MKKALLFLFVCTSVLAQTPRKVATAISDLQKQDRTFVPHSIFVINNSFANTEYQKSVENATIATLNLSEVNKIVAQNEAAIQLEIPYLNSSIAVLLYKVEVQTENFQLDTDKQKNVAVQKGVHYRGIIGNDPTSLVSFNFFNNQMNGVISGNGYANIVVGKLSIKDNVTDYIIYSDANLKTKNTFECATPDVLPKALPTENHNRSTNLTNRCVTIYFEIDYNLYLENGSVDQTYVWMTSVFNNVQTLYANDDINIALNSLYVWTTPDPYSGGSSFEYLDQFHEFRPSFNGDLGQLVGIDPGGLGGVAATIDGICSDQNYSYSDVFFQFNTVPTFSWTIMVVAHELGHLAGSPHTHGCYWNGDNSAIDGCGPTFGNQYAEGDCPIGPIPNNGGTIMSYCHLISAGINLSNGFGPQPAARIFQNVESSTCLSFDCLNTCILQLENITLEAVTSTSATISWNDVNPSNSVWQVACGYYPYEPEEDDWFTVDFNPVLYTNLASNRYMNFYVRPFCEAGLNTSYQKMIFATSDDFCAGREFTDVGGATANYGNLEEWTRTVMPSVEGAKIKVVFDFVDIEQGYDYLTIYDADNANDTTTILGGLSGNYFNETFQATNTTGALTFKFFSDEFQTGEGWTGNFSCLNLGVEDNAYIDFSYYPNPVTNLLAIKSKNEIQNIIVFSIDGKLLYESNSKQLDATIDMSNYASGTYVFKLQFENKPVTFKIVKQ